MSMPKIPDIEPNITLTRTQVIDMMLASVATEGLGLSHILNAQSEKILRFVNDEHTGVKDILQLNHSLDKVLRSVISSQFLIQLRLGDILQLEERIVEEEEICIEEEEYEE
ncbi:hypothetical protein HGO21_15365 [Acinetobacter sp. CUI P1]|uniref:hypothetical protein n=1 Tax=Paenibacillus sp. G2S3 TaxID=3047872 RepID=UPI001DBC20EF|nr:hypothetical protein [Paenibacillus sp. G2S3]MBY3620930.1 hypothetical protein [Acinetobacter sp. CUI P1]WHY16857.1 hypothetical protein QNH28_15080 [Paenibacillus sp. G2S3]